MTRQELELTPEERKLGEFLRASRSGPEFRPFAIFDEPMDCIRVVARDCSVKEIRINALLTVLEANYPKVGESAIVGFTIKGVAHLCETHGLPSTAPWRLADFIDVILKASTTPSERVVVNNVVKPIIYRNNLENVEMMAA